MLNRHPIIQYYAENNHFGTLLGMDFKIHSPGKIEYKMKVEEKHLATPVAAHGGVVCSLMDGTMGVAALSNVIQDNHVVSTIELKISFLAPAKLGDQLIGIGTVIKKGKRLLFVEGKIENQHGEKVAIASGTFNSYPAEKAFSLK